MTPVALITRSGPALPLEGHEAGDQLGAEVLRGAGRCLRRHARQARALLVHDGARHREHGCRVAIDRLAPGRSRARAPRSAGADGAGHLSPRDDGIPERVRRLAIRIVRSRLA